MSESDLREIEKILKDPSSGLREKVTAGLGNFTVALLRVTEHPTVTVELAGTGTLLVREGRHFILTARHVWERKLKTADRIGMTLKAETTQSFSINRKDVTPSGPPPPDGWNEWGPDIVLLDIPGQYIGTIFAHKVFLNANNQVTLRCAVLEVQVLMGTPAVLGTIVNAHADLTIVGMFRHGPEIEHRRGEFDYHDFDIDLSLPGPRTFGGVSGGGLWRVYLYRVDGQIDWKISLHGVAFFELPIVKERRIVRCHGSSSVQVAIRHILHSLNC